jgi:hypothetical protein
MQRSRLTLLVALIGLSLGCEIAGPEASPAICARPVAPAIVLSVRDNAGSAAAIGATVVVRSHRGFEDRTKGYLDSTQIVVGHGAGGIFDVHLSRPWHNDVVFRAVEVPEDHCGNTASTFVAVTLSQLPEAPEVRQVVAPPWSYGFGRGNMQHRLEAKVVAEPNVSQEVVWVTRDSSVIRMLPDGTLTTRCRSTWGQTWAVASSVVAPSVKDSVRPRQKITFTSRHAVGWRSSTPRGSDEGTVARPRTLRQ